MKLLVFGTGRFYQNRRESILSEDEVVAFVDNRADEIKVYEEKKVIHPNDIKDFNFDYILIMAADRTGIIKQLLDLKISKWKILEYEEYTKSRRRAVNHLAVGEKTDILSVVIVSDPLRYNGGAMAAVNAAVALRRKGYSVTIAVSYADERMVREAKQYGIGIDILERIPYVSMDDVDYFHQFDVALVNVFPMLRVACEVSKMIPVLWWIHESSDKYYSFYSGTRSLFWKYDNITYFSNARVAAVSIVAKKNMEQIYPNTVDSVFPIAVADEWGGSIDDGIISFAVIGTIFFQKAQLNIVRVFECLRKEYNNISCKIIGNIGDDSYFKEIEGYTTNDDSVKALGVLNRGQMNEAYKSIDVVLCASYEECLPTTIIEGMMLSKICITTDATGMAHYIEDGVNGFVCEAGNEDSLLKKMKYVIEHFDELDDVKKNARKTYEKYFTMEVFGDRLEKELLEAKKKFEANNTEAN